MAVDFGERKRPVPDEVPVAWDPIRRDLKEDEDWYRDLVEHSQDLLCIHDLEGRLLSVTPGAARLLGYSVEEILQKPMRELIDPPFRPQFDSYLREVAKQGECRGLLAVVTRSGEQRIWEYHNTLRTEGVSTPVVRGIAHDVTEGLRSEKALRASNEQLLKTAREQERTLQELTLFRTLLDQSSDAIEVVDPETLRFLDVNQRSCVELGYSREELLSMTVRDIDPNVDENLSARVRRQLQEPGFAIQESVHRRKDGTTFPVEMNMRRVRLDREYCVSISRDITERKRSEERLREFERVVENLEEMIVVVNREHRYVLANRAFLNYRRAAKEQIVGRLVAEVVDPELYDTVIREKLNECFQAKVVNFEHRCQYPGIGERDLSVTYLPVEGLSGIDRAACVIRDITERKQAEEALRESAAELREAQRVAHMGNWRLDLKSQTLSASEQIYHVMGVDPGEAHRPFSDLRKFFLPESWQRILQANDRALQTGRPEEVELAFYRPDGTTGWLLVRGEIDVDESGNLTGLHGIALDITERKRAGEALGESELRFRAVYERSPVGIALVDSRTGRFLQVNPKYCEITGRSEEELLQIEVTSITHPDDVAEGSQHLHELAEEELANYEMDKRYLRPDGTVRWVKILVVPMWDKGEELRWHMGLAQDITERRQAEEAIAALMQEVCEAKKKLSEEKLYLEQEIDTELGFEEIIGRSKALQTVMEQVGKVAASNATVLLLGETGTGKELVARAIHRLSRRANTSFIKMNCAAIPSGLLESELFGNEKGAFTGAISKKIGRLELADKGTLFLDEVGEISLALQPKLLRVLQDQEFERLGGTQTLKVDFRLIAATNCDLAESVRQNQFRRDLFYRLNVFPIRVPPLRERREDVPLLAEHFVQKFARRMKKSITSIPRKTMDALTGWEWPGNVRELENFIERSVILTQGSVLVSPLNELKPVKVGEKSVDESLEAAEREHILRALRESHGQVGGPRGAATRLGLKRTTLQSKLKHLGIHPRSTPPMH